jgi:hypothetical protein
MKAIHFTALAAAAVVAVAAATTADAPATTLDAAGAAHLAALQAAPHTAGERIYRGSVVALRSPAAPALFSYERRVMSSAEGLASVHITQDPSGKVIVAEQARVGPDFSLRRFDAVNAQLGYSGSVVVSPDGRHLEFRLNQGGKLSTASEDVLDPVVSGPSLHGFILRHWDVLASGEPVPVRMIVLAARTTYGFDIRRAVQDAGRTTFSITPSSGLVRLAVAPLSVTFDSTTRNLLRYEGRVPPMQEIAGKLEALDARVDYQMDAATYR